MGCQTTVLVGQDWILYFYASLNPLLNIQWLLYKWPLSRKWRTIVYTLWNLIYLSHNHEKKKIMPSFPDFRLGCQTNKFKW